MCIATKPTQSTMQVERPTVGLDRSSTA
eukprot:SAG31_NODE_26325_length_444_cov_0.901449_1_plen_27_part_10